jgi:soluble lytic murein transglycosylase-like protein
VKGAAVLSAQIIPLGRRQILQRLALHAMAGVGASGAVLPARAAGQIEEPLSQSVRTALSAAVAEAAPPEPVLSNDEQRQRYAQWLSLSSEQLKRWLPLPLERQEFLQTLWYEARRAGLSLSLVLGLIQTESAFRKYAISSAGARGYMQVMPFWARTIGDGDERKLFHMQTNLRFGCVILRYYLDREQGNVPMGLGRYNGSRGQAAYPNAVLQAQRRWQFQID